MKEIISPRILPVNFTAGKDITSFEFYNPLVADRQLGFGQVPSLPFFAGKVQFRGALNSALSYDRLKNLEPDVNMIVLPIGKLYLLPPLLLLNGGQNSRSISSAKLLITTASP